MKMNFGQVQVTVKKIYLATRYAAFLSSYSTCLVLRILEPKQNSQKVKIVYNIYHTTRRQNV